MLQRTLVRVRSPRISRAMPGAISGTEVPCNLTITADFSPRKAPPYITGHVGAIPGTKVPCNLKESLPLRQGGDKEGVEW